MFTMITHQQANESSAQRHAVHAVIACIYNNDSKSQGFTLNRKVGEVDQSGKFGEINDSSAVLFPLMAIEIGMEIIYFHSEK